MSLSEERCAELIEIQRKTYDGSKSVQDCLAECPACKKEGHVTVIWTKDNVYKLPEGTALCGKCLHKQEKKIGLKQVKDDSWKEKGGSIYAKASS